MDDKLNDLLNHLDGDIEKKCMELRKKKAEQKITILFAAVCSLFIIVPIVLIFIGVNIITFLFPMMIFIVLAMLILSPILLNNTLINNYEEVSQ